MRLRYKALILAGLVIAISWANAATVDEIQTKINDRSQQIKALEAEIQGYQKNLEETSKQSSTLNGELTILNTTIKKLDADTKLTQAKIATAEDTIEKLGLEIGKKDTSISENKESLGETLRLLGQSQNSNLIEQLAGEKSLTDFWSNEEQLLNLEKQVVNHVGTLRILRSDLSDKKTQTESAKVKLEELKAQLADQKKIADQNRQAKNKLLAETKNQETAYKSLLTDRKAKVAAFQQELFQFESQLKLGVDTSKLPHAGSGVLSWPLDSIYVTQNFGRTADSGRLYVSGTHNGVDFRASEGTPVKAARSGTVVATGNTDVQSTCYSYGKWILIDHHNGLSTLYGHLSLIKVSAGEEVSTGQLIGYSGRTGYATGPHLHLTVYATEGVRVERYANSINCKNVTIPVADTKAYLDPMLYL